MDGQEKILVCRCSDHVGGCQEAPVEHGGIAEEIGTCELSGDDGEDNVFC